MESRQQSDKGVPWAPARECKCRSILEEVSMGAVSPTNPRFDSAEDLPGIRDSAFIDTSDTHDAGLTYGWRGDRGNGGVHGRNQCRRRRTHWLGRAHPGLAGVPASLPCGSVVLASKARKHGMSLTLEMKL